MTEISIKLKAVVLFLLVLAVFISVKNFDFINFDDNVYVTENTHVNSGLNANNVVWAFTHEHGGHWHPLTWVSHQIDCQLFGLNPAPPHVINVIIHALNAALLFYLLVRLFGNISLAWLIAAIFSVHPLRIESVAWVTERKDVLSMFFGLANLLLYERYRRAPKRITYVAMLVLFTLGLLAKPSLVVLPVFLLFLDFWPFQKLKDRFLEKIPFFLIALCISLSTLWAQNHAGALKSLTHLSVVDRLSVACVGYVTYLWKTLWPTQLSVFYPLVKYPFSMGLAAFGVLSLLSFLFLKLRKKYPMILFAWIWFIIALLPVIGLMQIGGQAWANRWSYWPHVGIAIALCGSFSNVSLPYRKVIYGICVGILLLCIYQTRQELAYWRNSMTLFTHALDVSSPNFLAHTNLGAALEKKGESASAEYHYQEALKIDPLYSEALNNLGSLKAKQGDLNNAMVLFEKALIRSPHDPVAQYNLALALYMTGQKEKAIEGWRTITEESPDYAPAWESLRRVGR